MNVNSALFRNKLDQMVIIFIFAVLFLFQPKNPQPAQRGRSVTQTQLNLLCHSVIDFMFTDAKQTNYVI